MKLLQVSKDQYINTDYIVSIYSTNEGKEWVIRYTRPGDYYDAASISADSIYMVGLQTLLAESTIPLDSREF